MADLHRRLTQSRKSPSLPTQQVPVGMTDRDKLFLKSLYATDQKSKLQRNQIAHQMVHEIDH